MPPARAPPRVDPAIPAAQVSIAFILLIVLIGALPPALILDGRLMHGLMAALAATLLAIVSQALRPGEAKHLQELTRPLVIVAAAPALWMVVQLLPLGALGLAHPIWQSAQTALEGPLAGSL